MGTLHLVLKKEWFNKILSGEKKEEYRADTHYWQRRLFKAWCIKKCETITFSLGYKKDAPRMVVEWKMWKVAPNPMPNVIQGTFVNKLTLGKIIETSNINQ